MTIYISKRKGLTGEKLIGVTCGSVAVFFIILYIIIIMSRKKVSNNESWYKIICSSESESEMLNEYQQVQPINSSEAQKSANDDSDLDFWL